MEPNWQDIQSRLREVYSLQPFQIFFYGSRERKEEIEFSDFNYFMIASPQDQIRTGFITEVTDILTESTPDIPVSMINGDRDSVHYRMSIFEPTIVHLMEFGRPIFGESEIEKIREKWKDVKSKKPDFRDLIKYIDTRCKFHRSMSPKNIKEDIIRIEKILSLNMQSWILQTINDISITELAFLDIPARITKLIKILYKEQIPEDVQLLASIYEEVHDLKRSTRMLFSGAGSQLDRLKESILQIQDLSKEIEKIV